MMKIIPFIIALSILLFRCEVPKKARKTLPPAKILKEKEPPKIKQPRKRKILKKEKSKEMDTQTLQIFRQGIEYARQGEIKTAIQIFKKITRDVPTAFRAFYNLAALLERIGEDERAEENYYKAIQIKPDYEQAIIALGNLLTRKGKLEKALLFLLKKVEKFPNKLYVKIKYADLLIQNKSPEKAIRIAREVIRRDEQNIKAMLTLAKAYYSLHKYELSLYILDGIKELDPEFSEAWNLRGFILLSLGQTSEAIEAFKKAIALKEDYVEARNNLAHLSIKSENYEFAIKELEKVVKLSPNFLKAHLNLGAAYIGAKRYEEAKKELTKTLELDSKNADAHFNLGIMYLMADNIPGMDFLTQLQKAKTHLLEYKRLKGINLSPDDPVGKYIAEAERAYTRELKRLEREREKAKREKEKTKKEKEK